MKGLAVKMNEASIAHAAANLLTRHARETGANPPHAV